MKKLLIGLAALMLAACVSDPYRYNDSGYWSARERPRTSFSFSVGTGYGYCRPWVGPFAYGAVWSHGHCNGFALGRYYGSWYDPFWPYYGYYWRPHHHYSHGLRDRAYDLSRREMRDAGEMRRDSMTRYETLAPRRARDFGPPPAFGQRAYSSQSQPLPRGDTGGYRGGLSGARGGEGLSGAARSSSGVGGSRAMSAPAPRSSGRSEAASARSHERED